MATILPLLRWPAPVALLALFCAAGASAEEPRPPAAAAGAPARLPEPPGGAPKKPKTPKKPKKAAVQGVLNVNRATEAELQLLPGIGKGRAHLIVGRRPKPGYGSLEEVARIKGLRKLVQRLKRHLAIDGPTTLRPVDPAAPRGPSG